MKKSLFLILMIMTLFMCNKVYAYKEYKIGDVVKFDNENYHVIKNSNANKNYVVLLKDKPLTVDQIYQYGKDENDNLFINKYSINIDNPEEVVVKINSDNIGGISFYTSKNCKYNYIFNSSSYELDSYDIDNCKSDYKSSDIKKLIDNWSKKYENDLIKVDNYKARLIKYDEIVNHLADVDIDNTTSNDKVVLMMIYDWVFGDEYNYWTMDSYDDSNKLMIVSSDISIKIYNTIFTSAVRPVINVNKCSLNDSDKNCQKKEDITSDSNSLFNTYKIGDEIYYNNESYHVIEDSNGSSNYITLLKDNPLTYDELNIYGRDIENNLFIIKYLKNSEIEKIIVDGNIFGGMSYITRYYCSDSEYIPDKPEVEPFEYRYCISDYDSSNVRRTINKWIKSFENDLVSVDGYKARLIDFNELYYNLEYDSSKEVADLKYKWAYSDKYKYWSMISLSESSVLDIPSINSSEHNIIDKNAVRPVINLNKCAVEKDNPNCNNDILVKNCSTEKVNHYKEYKAGDEITYRGSKYHIMENSSNSKNYVTLFKDDSLTLNDLPNYKDNILNNMKLSNNVGYTQFLCDGTPCIDYENSNIKNIIENWTKFNFNENDLVEVGGYKSRIISEVDVLDNLGYSLGDTGSGHYIYYSSKDVPLVFPEIAAWTMFVIDDNYLLYTYDKSFDNEKDKDAYNIIIPVINVKKEVFNKISYNLGEQITYNNEQYYIISKDSPDKNYITLIRVKPFNQGEITLYQSDKNIFSIPYYISDTCNSGSNLSGCSSNFDKSEVKKIIDMWTQSFNDDLVEVEGYKARIPSKYDFIYNFYYDMDNVYATSYVYCSSNDTPKWVNIGYPYWSMEVFEDSNSLVYQNMKNGCLEVYKLDYSIQEDSFQSSSIRPVINVNKCAIGGCYETKECINDEKPSTTETIVEVAKTLKNIPKIILIICSVLVISGSAFIIYNYFKSKKERK